MMRALPGGGGGGADDAPGPSLDVATGHHNCNAQLGGQTILQPQRSQGSSSTGAQIDRLRRRRPWAMPLAAGISLVRGYLGWHHRLAAPRAGGRSSMGFRPIAVHERPAVRFSDTWVLSDIGSVPAIDHGPDGQVVPGRSKAQEPSGTRIPTHSFKPLPSTAQDPPATMRLRRSSCCQRLAALRSGKHQTAYTVPAYQQATPT